MRKNSHLIFLIIIVVIASFLRLWKLDQVPVSLFGDEMDVGYQAYSILKTGKDYYGNFLPFHFHSLAEWRTPLYLYSAVPTVFLFGITPLGVRLPAAIFGILNIVAIYYLVRLVRQNYFEDKSGKLELLAAFVWAISPWHIQYSRGGFEVTQLLLFITLGLYFFFKGFKRNKYLYLSALFFALTPWIYSTAKLFIPMFIPALALLYSNELLKINKPTLVKSFAVFALVSLPVIYSILAGSGSQRFGYISVFTTENIEQQVGENREQDVSSGSYLGKVFHNKYTSWASSVTNNYLQAFSSEFLFINGDINFRHSIDGMGMFYKVEAIALIIGVVAFFSLKNNRKMLSFVIFLVVFGAIPSAITRDGGNHATRLILVFLPLSFLISYGLYAVLNLKNKITKTLFITTYFSVLALLFINYQHQYWIHNPRVSEKWWHYGWSEVTAALKEQENNYEKIVISTADEPPWVFFAASYQYPPDKWQANFPLENKVFLEGFGEVSHIDKFYFGSPEMKDVYDFAKVMDEDTLYLATAFEVGPDLIAEPERVPSDLNLVKAISYPSGAPAFYLFAKK